MATKSFLIQPIDLCNLNCTYCYLPGRKDPNRMSFETLKKTIKTILTWEKLGNRIVIDWNAGEPLTAKIDFYQTAFELIKSNCPTDLVIRQNIQTNGTLLNEDWCKLFCQYNIGVGISIDGPAFIHDHNRKKWNGEGSHALVQRGIDLIRQYRDGVSGVCVLTDFSLDYPDEIFDYFLTNGFKSVGFNIEELEGFNGKSSLFEGEKLRTTSAKRYLKFFEKIYELWAKHSNSIEIREFNAFKKKFSDLYLGRCLAVTRYDERELDVITISKNGDLSAFSPEMSGGGRLGREEFVVGNIHQVDSLTDILNNANYIRLNQEIRQGVELCQNTCDYFSACGGGFPVNKYWENLSFASTETGQCFLTVKVMADFLSKKWEKVPIKVQ